MIDITTLSPPVHAADGHQLRRPPPLTALMDAHQAAFRLERAVLCCTRKMIMQSPCHLLYLDTLIDNTDEAIRWYSTSRQLLRRDKVAVALSGGLIALWARGTTSYVTTRDGGGPTPPRRMSNGCCTTR